MAKSKQNKRKPVALLRDGVWTTTRRIESKGRVRPKPSKYQNFDSQYRPKRKMTIV